ncbi:hypothetical protein Mgra_00005357 [Meloidogyne graminicola]|uniref:MFS domain-containing protein n=1 Tax=Meloidogyne graminicola TaxID=189291 RepID=A0A8S9ZPW9_9BILA|nr:hypothetical protein Mgra_00005357 [Meloidogyne graminicola]
METKVVIISSQILKTNWKSIYIVAIVAFISSLEFAASNDWNYFCQLDSSATITFYGILRTVGGLSAGISTLISGWLCNKLKDTRQILILSKLLIFVATGFFLGAELVYGFLFYTFFLCYKIFMGIATGGGSMARTHVAMASTEIDRDKAIALTTLLPSIVINAGTNNKNINNKYSFDLIAVLICCYTQLVISLAMLNLLTITSPYQQLAFQWDASQLQFYGGLTGAAVAFQLIIWPAAYMFFGLNKIISERISIMFGLILLIFGYLFTYSWPFLTETFPYSLNSSSSFLNNNNTNNNNNQQQTNNCGSKSNPGCPFNYNWCKTTTKPNILLYIISFVLSTGMAIPILRMNLDILYSKILGNIKQGIMQGFFVVCQGIIEILGGSIAVSWVFEKSGPKHIWEFICFQLILCLFCWIIFYKRMISKNQNRWQIN